MKPYKPERYFYRDAAHLLRRAGFGGSVEEVEAYRKLGPEAAVDLLLTPQPDSGESPFDWRGSFDGNNAGGPIGPLTAWWLHRMLEGPNPLVEKLTLFWHGHFATGRDKVNNAFALAAQNELFRQQGLGDFADLVLEVSRDPAMLRYLDNDENVKAHPNENYARELMELFTMGVHGGYTEKDVPLDGLTLAQMRTVEPKITRDVFKVLTVEASVAARKSLGGTAPANVARAVADARKRFLR